MQSTCKQFWRALGALCVGALTSGAAHGAGETGVPPDSAVTEEQFAAWVQANAIPVQRWEMNPALEAYFDAALHDKRIVFIGEPGHFFREKYDVQLMLIENLARRGYRHVFIEGLGATMSAIVDDFVASDAQFTAPGADAGTFERYRARVLGRPPDAEASEFQRRLSAAQWRFFNALRQINAAQPEQIGPLAIHPLDIDSAPGGCRLTINDLLDRYPDDHRLAALRADCARQGDDEPLAQWRARLETMRSRIERNTDDLLMVMSPADRHSLRQCIDCLVESLAFTETKKADGVLDRALVRREPAMFRQVQFAMEQLPADARVIMLAHCNHLARVGADLTRARRPSVGELLSAAYPGEIFSLWMLHDHGWLLNPLSPEPVQKFPSDPERIESLMVRAGSTYLLPLHTGGVGERYLDEKRRFSYFTWYETATLNRQTDARFSLDEIRPLTE